MPNKEQYWKNKKSCLDCGNLIARTSERCFLCSRIKLRKYSNKEETNYKKYNILKNREQNRILRELVFKKLGHKCVKCGFDDKRALHFDHINNDGYNDRKMNGWNSPGIRYKRILADKENRFQVLCANCNFIKKHGEITKRNMLIYAD